MYVIRRTAKKRELKDQLSLFFVCLIYLPLAMQGHFLL